MTSIRDRAIRIARQAVRLPVAERVLIVDALLFSGVIPDFVDRRVLNAERDDRIRQYRADWHADLSGNAAAEEIDKELDRYAATAWLQHQHLVDPGDVDTKRRAQFAILKCGPVPRYESLRKILRG